MNYLEIDKTIPDACREADKNERSEGCQLHATSRPRIVGACALPPNVPDGLVRNAIIELLNWNKYKEALEQEDADKQRLRNMLEGRA